jgi:prepilin-type processing-associated H-X9-DG protein
MPYFFQYLPALYQQGLPGVMICPADNLMEVFGGGLRGAYPRLKDSKRTDVYYSYALNICLPKRIKPYYTKPPIAAVYWDAFNPSSLTQVRTPSECAILFETASPAGFGYRTADAFPNWFRFTHQGGKKMNVLMCDGHAEPKSAKEIMPGSPASDTTHWPTGFRSFWFGKPDVNDQIILR